MPFARPFFGLGGFVLWCIVVGLGTVTAVTHWRELSQDVLDRVLLPENLLMMWLVFPVL